MAADVDVERYRAGVSADGLVSRRVVLKQSNLMVSCEYDATAAAYAALARRRRDLESYIAREPSFVSSLRPVPVSSDAPEIVQDMARAGQLASVGPMAAVAGALAEAVGRSLLRRSREVLIENGGDLFCVAAQPRVVSISAGRSPLSGKLGIVLTSDLGPVGIGTSGGTVGYSLSFGAADAACVVATGGALADAAATAVGNSVRTAADLPAGLRLARSIEGVLGAVIIIGDHFGACGGLELVSVADDRSTGQSD